MHVQYEKIPCSGLIEEVLSVDADADADAKITKFTNKKKTRHRTNSARISHPPPFRRVTKNDKHFLICM